MVNVKSIAGNTHLAVCWNVVSAAALYQGVIGTAVGNTARLSGSV